MGVKADAREGELRHIGFGDDHAIACARGDRRSLGTAGKMLRLCAGASLYGLESPGRSAPADAAPVLPSMQWVIEHQRHLFRSAPSRWLLPQLMVQLPQDCAGSGDVINRCCRKKFSGNLGATLIQNEGGKRNFDSKYAPLRTYCCVSAGCRRLFLFASTTNPKRQPASAAQRCSW
jgi:hypothetical protein